MEDELGKPRVLILCHNPLFAQGIASILAKESALEVSLLNAKEPKLLERLKEAQPDVVMIERSNADAALSATEVWEAAPEAMVVGLRLGDNTVNIYFNERVAVIKPEDLTGAILSRRLLRQKKPSGRRTSKHNPAARSEVKQL